MKKIVVSGINLFRGGTLKVMQEFISILSKSVEEEYEIIALVHDQNQYEKYDNVKYISYPKSRKSYFYRLYYEYFGFKKLSKELKPYYWISMHDSTPNVYAENQAVYCHNPFPFYNAGFRELLLQPNIFLLSLFSYYIYKINIKKNKYVVVQQEWIKQEFKKMFSINNILIALPSKEPSFRNFLKKKKEDKKVIFFYPTTSIIHKNIETLCESVKILLSNGIDNFEIRITIDPEENRYSKYIYKRYKNIDNLLFVGYLNQQEMHQNFIDSDCIVFPSFIETWGLPISEAKEYNKPILVSDLPYAYETVGKYDKVKFFNPYEVHQLVSCMQDFINRTIIYDNTNEIIYDEPFFDNWKQLICFLIKN